MLDVGLSSADVLLNGACQLSSFTCAEMVPTIFLPGWLLSSFYQSLAQGNRPTYRKGSVLRIAAPSAPVW